MAETNQPAKNPRKRSGTMDLNRPDEGATTLGYNRLRSFLDVGMTMSHVYQPLMIKTILTGGGAATRRQIAGAFLAADLSQLEYYEEITKRYPTQTLKRHGIIEHHRGVYRLSDDFGRLNEWERASLVALCDAKVAEYVAQRQDNLWRHRAQNFDPVPGTLRYEVLKRAKGRCEACGVSNQERALQVDHIVPRSFGGSNDTANLQVLCSTCNAQKLDHDRTDFRRAQAEYAKRDPSCTFCNIGLDRIVEENELAVALANVFPTTQGHTLIVPRRHVAGYFDLWQPEMNAIRELELRVVALLKGDDSSVAGFTVATNVIDAGQIMPHCHIHLIPQRGEAFAPGVPSSSFTNLDIAERASRGISDFTPNREE